MILQKGEDMKNVYTKVHILKKEGGQVLGNGILHA